MAATPNFHTMQTMAENSMSMAQDAGDVTAASILTATDPLDLANLGEFEDEAALINDLLAGNDLLNATGGGLGIEDEQQLLLQTHPRQAAALPDLDVKLARLLGTLEHACQDTSVQVERSIEEVSRSVPRLTFDLQLMRENVVLLRYTLDSIRKRSNEAISTSETSNVMRRLKVLDTIKTRMEASRDVLREAEAWSSLESEVTALVQEQSYVKAAERLAEANKSMIVFQNSPEYEQRRNLMVSLQNGLEAGLSASLVAAITARDMTACKNYHAIFRQIQRETEFRNYYFGSRRAHLVKEWQNAQLSDCPMSSSTSSYSAQDLSKPFSQYLPTFWNALENTMNDERTYIPAIFNDPIETLSAFLQTTLDALSPSFPQRISDLSNSHGPRLLIELIKIYHSTEECAVAIERTFSTLQSSLAPTKTASPLPSPSTPGGPMPTSPNGTPGPTTGPPPSTLAKQRLRRQSKAMSISRRHSRAGTNLFAPATGGLAQHRGSTDSAAGGEDGLSAGGNSTIEPILAWETTLFEPFLDWQAEYADLESRLLKSDLARVTNGQDAMTFLLGSLSISRDSGAIGREDEDDYDDDASTTGMNKAKEAAKLLLDQTSSVIELAEEALGRCMAFTHGYGAAGYIEAVDETLKTFFIKERDTLLRAKDSRMRKRRQEMTSAISASGAGEVDHHLDYSHEDMTSLQMALRLLESCKAIVKKVDQLEHRVSTRLVDVVRLVREARADPLNQVIPGTTRGPLALLWQSTLNSAALNTLLESIDSGTSQHRQSVQLFHQARSASSEITRAAQLFLHETILTPLMAILDGYASLAVWTQPSESRPEARGAFDLHIPTFSLSPSEIITRIGEGFLNLPAMFEMYAEDVALGFSLDTLPDLDPEMVKSLRRELQAGEGGANGSVPLPSPHGSHGQQQARHASKMSIVGNEFLPPSATNLDSPARPPRISPTLATNHTTNPLASASPSADHQPWSTETIISAWLSSLTRSILLHLAKIIIPSIPSLSKHGQEQLASDLGYISNVAKALDVEVEQVEKWRIALEAEERQNKPARTAGTVGAGQPTEEMGLEEEEAIEVDPEVAEMLKRMRSGTAGRPTLTR